MRARTSVAIGGDGTLARLHCEPPLTVRRVGTDDGRLGLCLVGSAAGPLPGDDLALDLRLHRGARARLTASGASIAQGRGGPPASLSTSVVLESGADLDAAPGALVAAEGSRVDVSVAIELAERATVVWREIVVLGRTGDAEAGAVTLRWDVTRAGRPVLRQLVDLADPRLRGWVGSHAGRRVLAATLYSGPGVLARTVVASPTAVAQRVDAHTVLVTVLAADAVTAQAGLAELAPAQSQANPASGASSASTEPSMSP